MKLPIACHLPLDIGGGRNFGREFQPQDHERSVPIGADDQDVDTVEPLVNLDKSVAPHLHFDGRSMPRSGTNMSPLKRPPADPHNGIRSAGRPWLRKARTTARSARLPLSREQRPPLMG
jgi:hypothetical protein